MELAPGVTSCRCRSGTGNCPRPESLRVNSYSITQDAVSGGLCSRARHPSLTWQHYQKFGHADLPSAEDLLLPLHLPAIAQNPLPGFRVLLHQTLAQLFVLCIWIMIKKVLALAVNGSGIFPVSPRL